MRTVDNTGETTSVVDPTTIDHDSLLNYVANEHIDWTDASVDFKTSGNLTATDGVAVGDGKRFVGKILIPSIATSATDCALQMGNQNNGLYGGPNDLHMSISGVEKSNHTSSAINESSSAAVSHYLYGRVAVTDTYSPNMTDSYHMSIESAQPAFSVYRKTGSTNLACMIFQSNVGGTKAIRFVIRSSGDCENTNNSYGAISDKRLKTDIEDARSYLADIRKLKLKKYKNVAGRDNVGFVADDIESIFPSLVYECGDTPFPGVEKPKALRYSPLYCMNLQATIEIADKLDALEAKVNIMETDIMSLQVENELLTRQIGQSAKTD